MDMTPYDIDLDRNPANFQPLTPLSFLERAAAVFPDRTAIIHGALQRSYAEFYARARRLACALARRGIKRGDTVSAVLANTPAMLECHYGVPMAGAVLNTINTRLDAADRRVPARSCRSQGADRRSRILQAGEGGAGARQGEAAGHRLRRPRIHRRRRAAGRRSNTRISSPPATPTSRGACRTTNGTRSRSTTPRAPPAIPRASSITIAAPICSRSATC